MSDEFIVVEHVADIERHVQTDALLEDRRRGAKHGIRINDGPADDWTRDVGERDSGTRRKKPRGPKDRIVRKIGRGHRLVAVSQAAAEMETFQNAGLNAIRASHIATPLDLLVVVLTFTLAEERPAKCGAADVGEEVLIGVGRGVEMQLGSTGAGAALGRRLRS